MTNQTPDLPPGFRFHPTDEELILYYLRCQASSSSCPVPIIAEVDIYKFDPWNLPDKAMFGDREWYFFSPRDRKYPNGVRPNRAAASGYWKATGTDKPITTGSENENIGVKKALVFYKGKPPKGVKTNWIMHEYRLCDNKNKNSYRPMKLKDSSMRLDDWVLCRIYKRNGHDQDDVHEESDVSNTAYMAQGYEDDPMKMHKSFSVSELLNETDIADISQLLDAPTTNTGIDNQNLYGMNQRSLKRQRPEEENYLQGQKLTNINSWTAGNFSSQLDFDSQAYINQQLMFNSQLDMQQKWLS